MKFKTTAALLFMTSSLFAQNKIDDATKRMNEIVQNGSLAQKNTLANELSLEAKTSKDANRLEVISNYLYQLGREESSDSLRSVIAKKYPKSLVARQEFVTNDFYKQKTAKDKENSYKKLLKKWPIPKTDEIKIAYDYLIANIANSYIEEGNKEKSLSYLNQLNERFWRAQGFIPVATTLLQQGDTLTAIPLIQTSIEDAEYFMNLPKDQQDNKAGFAAVGYPGYVSQLANIYSNQGKHKEVMTLLENAISKNPTFASRFSNTYFKALENAGRKLEALQQLEMIYKSGNFAFKTKMHELYTSLNSSDKGFEGYINRLDNEVIKYIQEHISQFAINQTMPNFELLNLKGEKVSLESLKGKTLVLDFWATWCGPCIRSFPAMKAAQEMYANDNNVKFLFINTWERDKNYKENVASFISKNNYPFEVVYDDQKDPNNGKILAEKLGITGIPAKFIVDKDGIIRYKLTGSSSEIDYIKLEMKELIESAKKPISQHSLAKK